MLKSLGSPVAVVGLPGVPPQQVKLLPPASINAKVLCQRHNSLLSGLDSCATRLFKIILEARADKLEPKLNTYRTFLFNGDDIERWMLKTICGTMAARHKSWKPPSNWSRIIFEEEPMPTGCGLYFPTKVRTSYRISGKICIDPIYAGSTVLGAVIAIGGVRFTFVAANPQNHSTLNRVRDHTHRVASIKFDNNRTTYELMFGFDDFSASDSVSIDWSKLPPIEVDHSFDIKDVLIQRLDD